MSPTTSLRNKFHNKLCQALGLTSQEQGAASYGELPLNSNLRGEVSSLHWNHSIARLTSEASARGLCKSAWSVWSGQLLSTERCQTFGQGDVKLPWQQTCVRSRGGLWTALKTKRLAGFVRSGRSSNRLLSKPKQRINE